MSSNSDNPYLDSKLISQAIEMLTNPLQREYVDEVSPDLAFFKTLQDTSINFTRFLNSNKSIKDEIDKSIVHNFLPLSCIAADNLKLIYYEYTSHLLRVSNFIAVDRNNKFINISLQNQITKLFQFIFSLCIVPFLVPGNGPPLSERSVTLKYLTKHKSKLTLATLTCHLIRCCDVILKQSYITYLVPHIRDVIASILQISYYNGCKESAYSIFADRCVWYRDRCSELLARFETPLVVSEIMVLQGLARQAEAKWVIKVTSQELSKILVGPLGIQSVLRGFLDVITKDLSSDIMDYTKLRVIANVIATCPGRNRDEYYTSVCDQLLNILHLRNESLKCDVITAGISVIEALVVNQPLCAEGMLLNKITLPLERITTDITADLIEDELTQTINDIHDVITRIPEWYKLIETWISKYISLLFHLYCFDVGKITSIRSVLYRIIGKYFLYTESEHCISFVEEALSYFHNRHMYPGDVGITLHHNLAISLGDEGSLQVTKGDSDNDVMIFLPELFLLLETSDKCVCYQSVLISLLCWLAELVESHEDYCTYCSGYREGVLYLVAQLLEERGEYILAELDTEPILQWITRIVLIHHGGIDKYYNLDEYNAGVFGGTSSLSMAFGSLTFLLSSSKEVSIEISRLLQELLPYLEEMGERFPDELLRAQSADLRICIATCGAVWSDLLATSSSTNKSVYATGNEDMTESTDKGSNFSEALSHSLDPMLPIRANGIQQLSKLIYKRDEEALSKADQLFKLFKENLRSEDSYLYLAAISGIASLSYVRPREVLSDISAQFAAFTQQATAPLIEEISNDKPNYKPTHTNTLNSVEFRIKLGEVLIRAARESGELFPHYGDVILRALLTGVRDRDPMVRASALSNLSECCVLLGYSLSKCVEEVVSCMEHLIPSEQDATVRCAAILVISRILDKPQEQILQIFGGGILRRSYQLLKLVHSSDPDLTTRTQAQSGIERLNRIMKQFLTPVTTGELRKNIYVLDKPPDVFDWKK
ncbi:hypothetical protein LOD99_5086 [Oopsacas minuta]|uniref:Uncharacterized protein n=1 Tax=Oopsacas minuta TaxID=111878 RepID=A0AAV7JR59_9METZ|nr:hypothetical protein LOD99_5086 [Oopsacas minuta]